MGIQNWSESVILVNLATEPQLGEELEAVTSMVTTNGNVDVVVDFSDVDIITSSSIAKLLKLRKTLVDSQHKLVFASLSPQTLSVFKVTGLDTVFEFVDDQFLALASLQLAV